MFSRRSDAFGLILWELKSLEIRLTIIVRLIFQNSMGLDTLILLYETSSQGIDNEQIHFARSNRIRIFSDPSVFT